MEYNDALLPKCGSVHSFEGTVLVTLILLTVNSCDVRLRQWTDRTDENLHGYNYRPSAT